METKHTPWIVFIIIGASALGAVAFAATAILKVAPKDFWQDTTIACYKDLSVSPAVKVGATLELVTDGVPELVGGVGVAQNCVAEIHTVGEPGTIEAISTDPARTFTLNDFFTVWGKPIEKEGYTMTGTVNGTTTPDIASYVLQDNDKITLIYSKIN